MLQYVGPRRTGTKASADAVESTNGQVTEVPVTLTPPNRLQMAKSEFGTLIARKP